MGKIKDPIERAYNKQISLLKRRVREAQAKGYYFRENPIPEIRPTTITEDDVQAIYDIRGDLLYQFAMFIDMESGEILGTGAEKLHRKIKSSTSTPVGQKATQQDVSTLYSEADYLSDNNITWFLEKFAPPVEHSGKSESAYLDALRGRNVVLNMYYSELATDPEGLAQRLEEHESEIETLVDDFYGCSDGSTVAYTLVRLESIITDRTMTMDEYEAMGGYEDYFDYLENME